MRRHIHYGRFQQAEIAPVAKIIAEPFGRSGVAIHHFGKGAAQQQRLVPVILRAFAELVDGFFVPAAPCRFEGLAEPAMAALQARREGVPAGLSERPGLRAPGRGVHLFGETCQQALLRGCASGPALVESSAKVGGYVLRQVQPGQRFGQGALVSQRGQARRCVPQDGDLCAGLRKNRRNKAQQGAQPFGRLAAFVHLAGNRHRRVRQC